MLFRSGASDQLVLRPTLLVVVHGFELYRGQANNGVDPLHMPPQVSADPIDVSGGDLGGQSIPIDPPNDPHTNGEWAKYAVQIASALESAGSSWTAVFASSSVAFALSRSRKNPGCTKCSMLFICARLL